MEANHTPGPWIFYADLPSVKPNWHLVATENRLRVLATVHIEPGNPVDVANARLIASAPDLLKALKKALPFIPPTAIDIGMAESSPVAECYINSMVRASIAKAEGR